MRTLILATGSRGDVQPLVALGCGLRAGGYDVTVAAARDFRALVEGHDLPFRPLSHSAQEQISSEAGRSWLGHSSDSSRRELALLKAFVDAQTPAVVEDALAMVGAADLFVSGVLTVDVVDALTRVGGGRHVLALLAPFAPTRSGPAVLWPVRPGGRSVANAWAARLSLWAMAGAFGGPGRAVRSALGLRPSDRRDYAGHFVGLPSLVGASPLVVPPPEDWPAHAEVTGYWTLDAPEGYRPPPDLEAFLAAGEPPVYVGFGSMSTHDPVGTWRTIREAVDRAGVRAVVHRGAAGLGAGLGPEEVPATMLVVDDVPHEWLFPRCAATVHHGGAGTTGAALRAGVPTGVVAHIGDQNYWGRRVHELGVGPPPVRRHRANAAALGAMISRLVGDPALSARARMLGERLRQEDGVGAAVAAVDRYVGGGR